MKAKILKRIVAVLCAISILTSFVITSVGAISEAGFSLRYLDSLPKPGETGFDKLSGKYERDELENKKYNDKLQHKRKYDVKYPNGDNDFKIVEETIDEKIEYEKVKQTVNELKRKVDRRTPDDNANVNDIQLGINNKEISKHYDMPQNMRLAKAIYRWVAKEISYDHDSLKNVKGVSLRKPQDALYVFTKRIGVCAGKANLVNLMLRMAGIPSVYIGAFTHAYNAVYLEDKENSDRTGWTLIDVTWAAPKSDMNQQLGIVKNTNEIVNKEVDEKKKADEINKLIKGTVAMSAYFMRDNFDMNDEYAIRINNIIYISLKKRAQMNDVDIGKFNKELEEKLKKLNDVTSDDNKFKINKFKVFRNKEGKFYVEYETNLDKNKAEGFYKEREKKYEEMEAKKLLQTESTSLFDITGFGPLDGNLFRRLNSINKLRDSSKLNLSRKYSQEFKTFLKNLVQQYQDELETNVNKIINKKDVKESKTRISEIVREINRKIEIKLEDLNKEYEDIAKFKKVKIDTQYSLLRSIGINNDGSSVFVVLTELILPVNDDVTVLRKQADNDNKEGSFKEFFPGFYDKTITLKNANEEVVEWGAHKIKEILVDNRLDSDEGKKILTVGMKIDGVTYRLLGDQEGQRREFELTGEDEKQSLENVEISSDMVSVGVKFKIGSGIKSIKLKGNEILDLSEAKQLKSIDITESKAYIFEKGLLYERNSDNSQGRKIDVPNGILIVNKNSQRQ